MKDGEKYLKGNKKCLIVFTIIFLLYICYCICLTPSYILEKCLKYNDVPWTIINVFFKNSVIRNFYLKLRYKIPDFTPLPAFLINVGNIVWGFVRYKKKWWYYLILVLSILCSVLLLDYYEIYTYDDV